VRFIASDEGINSANCTISLVVFLRAVFGKISNDWGLISVIAVHENRAKVQLQSLFCLIIFVLKLIDEYHNYPYPKVKPFS